MAALPSGLRIRPYEPRDYDDVWRIHLEGVIPRTPQQLQNLTDALGSGYEDDLRSIQTAYLEAGAFWVVEAEGGTLVGMTAVQRRDDATAQLRRMRVSPDWRRRGIGQALVEHAVEFCRGRGFRRLILDTTDQQVAAQRLYERAGFLKTGERTLGVFHMFDYERPLD